MLTDPHAEDGFAVDLDELRRLPLHEEHVLLGARFVPFGSYQVVGDYGPLECLDEPLEHPLLTDESYQGLFRVSGKDAYHFLQTMCTADVLALTQVGDRCYSLVLSSEAEIIDLVDIVKSGDDEFLVIANAPHIEELYDWFEVHAALEDVQGAVFPDVALSDESDALGQFVLGGPGSSEVLEELAGAAWLEVPHDGALFMLKIGEIPVMTLRESFDDVMTFRLFFPVASSIVFWRALLSFPEVQVIGRESYSCLLEQVGVLLPGLQESGYLTPAEAGLEHLLRNERDFVGARALEPIE
jgi:aminomethyltransferase